MDISALASIDDVPWSFPDSLSMMAPCMLMSRLSAACIFISTAMRSFLDSPSFSMILKPAKQL